MTSDDTYRKAGRPTKAHSIELARALIRQTKAALCPCGVRPNDCADHRETADHDPARQPAPEESA